MILIKECSDFLNPALKEQRKAMAMASETVSVTVVFAIEAAQYETA